MLSCETCTSFSLTYHFDFGLKGTRANNFEYAFFLIFVICYFRLFLSTLEFSARVLKLLCFDRVMHTLEKPMGICLRILQENILTCSHLSKLNIAQSTVCKLEST